MSRENFTIIPINEQNLPALVHLGWSSEKEMRELMESDDPLDREAWFRKAQVTQEEFDVVKRQLSARWKSEPVTRGLLHELLVSLSNSKDQTDQVKYGTLADIVYDMGRSHV